METRKLIWFLQLGLLITSVLSSTFARTQGELPNDWSFNFSSDGSIKVSHPNYPKKAELLIRVDVNDSIYSFRETWNGSRLPQEISAKNMGFNANLIASKRTIHSAKYFIKVDGREVYQNRVLISPKPKNQLFSIKELPIAHTPKGEVIAGIHYWNDQGGHNYLIQSSKSMGSGIYLEYLNFDFNGKVSQQLLYMNELECGPKLERVQRHHKDIGLTDADKDGVMECYAAIIDDCLQVREKEKAYQYVFVCSKSFPSFNLHGTLGAIEFETSVKLDQNNEVLKQLINYRSELTPNN